MALEGIGPHFFTGSNPGPGYGGKGFMLQGAEAMHERFIISLTSIAGRRRGFAPTAVRLRTISSGKGHVVHTNMRPMMTTWTAQMLGEVTTALHDAGRVGKLAALRAYGASYRGSGNVGKPSDNTNIPDNIDYDVFGGGVEFGVTLGFIEDSPKSLAQEYGLY